MSETTADAEVDAAAEGEEAAGKKKKLAGKKLVLFVVLPALLKRSARNLNRWDSQRR